MDAAACGCNTFNAVRLDCIRMRSHSDRTSTAFKKIFSFYCPHPQFYKLTEDETFISSKGVSISPSFNGESGVSFDV